MTKDRLKAEVMSVSRVEALFEALPPMKTLRVYRRSPAQPSDPGLVELFKRESSGARLMIQGTHKRLKIVPSWAAISTATSVEDEFADMESARDWYYGREACWLPGWPTPAESLVCLALEANRQAELAAWDGDVDAACQLYMEGQAYLLELEAAADEICAGQEVMKRLARRSADEARWDNERERQRATILGSVEVAVAKHADSLGRAGAIDVVLALEAYWDKQDSKLGFQPDQMLEHIKRLAQMDPGFYDELCRRAGVRGIPNVF